MQTGQSTVDHLVSRLLVDLKDPADSVRQHATAQLWRIWFQQKGMWGMEQLRRAQARVEAGDLAAAEALLDEIIADNPDFAEAWNRRAMLYYCSDRFAESRDDCQQVVELVPFHFGAWHGLGLCHAALGDFREAIAAFRKALEIQPYATVNQKLILECTMQMT